MVVLVLHCLSLEIISLVTSTSKSNITFRSDPSWISSWLLIVVLFLAKRLALIAAIFSTDIASESDLMLSTVTEASFGASRRAANCCFTR
uniref:Secreted protein n=1 Tax=Panstrongylus lignarius TaxID=156445 RepID=A0A224XRS5_9HEMI